jgi:NADPH oxidase
MTQAAMKGSEKDEKTGMTRGDFVEIDSNNVTLPAVRIDGPYGAPAEDVFNAEVAILIGAGIGRFSQAFLSIIFDDLLIQ